jgi:hypothetical protein
MPDRLALLAALEERAAELSDAALATLGALAHQLCGRCGAKAGTRSSRREGRVKVAYLECRKCGWRGKRSLLCSHKRVSRIMASKRDRHDTPGEPPMTTSQLLTSRWRQLEAALAISAGLPNIERHYDGVTLNAAAEAHRYGLSLQEAMRAAARENGRGEIWGNDVGTLFRAAFAPPPFVQASGFSTVGLSGVLSNLANKIVLEAFEAVEQSWRMVCSKATVTDFKQRTSYSLTGSLEFEKVGPAGEIKHGSVGELPYTNQAETYARMLALTRTDIINDDLGAFTRLPRMLGRGAALKINNVFWSTFLAGVGTFWHGDRNNLITGSDTALDPASLGAAATKFAKQVDSDGQPLGSQPRILLVPTELEITAAELMTSATVNTGGASTADRVPSANIWRSKFKVASSAYLSNTAYANHSSSAWWLLADPNDLPTIEVAFLGGRDMPVVESAEADFNTLGVQLRGYYDFGVSLMEYRGSVRSDGQ